jgi:hypothetical protein
MDLYKRSGRHDGADFDGPPSGASAPEATCGVPVKGQCPVVASRDGRRIYFETLARLVPEDVERLFVWFAKTSTSCDKPRRTTTTLVSTGPTAGSGSGFVDATFAASLDGTRVFFMTTDNPAPGGQPMDTPTSTMRSSDGLELVSTGPTAAKRRSVRELLPVLAFFRCQPTADMSFFRDIRGDGPPRTPTLAWTSTTGTR